MEHKTDTDSAADALILKLRDILDEARSYIGAPTFSPSMDSEAAVAVDLADQYLAGRASLAASAGGEPVAPSGWREAIGEIRAGLEDSEPSGYDNSGYRAFAGTVLDAVEDALTELTTHPSPPEGMVGGLQVYRCKIKSRKQIDKEIPREQQGWWADVSAGQKLLLRQAVQSDIDRCTLGGKRSRNPADYMCETQTHGSLVSKVALEYMNPEENVFAAAPPIAAGGGKDADHG